MTLSDNDDLGGFSVVGVSIDRCGIDNLSSSWDTSCDSQMDPLNVSCWVPLKNRWKTFHCAKAKAGLMTKKIAESVLCGSTATYVTPKDTARMITVVVGGEYPFVRVSCKASPMNKVHSKALDKMHQNMIAVSVDEKAKPTAHTRLLVDDEVKPKGA